MSSLSLYIAKFKKRKEKIKKDFRIKLGILVDQPKQGWSCTNVGNIAQRFFQNLSLSAPITEVDKDIIIKFHTLLWAISCALILTFKNLKNMLWPQYENCRIVPSVFMPTTVHKILVHDSKIMKKLSSANKAEDVAELKQWKMFFQSS